MPLPSPRRLRPLGEPSPVARAVAGARAAFALGALVAVYCGAVAGWQVACAIAGAQWREG